MNGAVTPFAKGEALCVPAGSVHNVRNSGDESISDVLDEAPFGALS